MSHFKTPAHLLHLSTINVLVCNQYNLQTEGSNNFQALKHIKRIKNIQPKVNEVTDLAIMNFQADAKCISG